MILRFTRVMRPALLLCAALACSAAPALADGDVQSVKVAGIKDPEMRSYRSVADGVTLRLAMDETSIPIPVDPDGGFVIARNQAAWDADAIFVLNQRQGAYKARAEVRTPGLPDNVRRLGDLRLECQVTVAIVQQELPFLAKAAINTLLMTSDWCGKKNVNFGFHSGVRLTGASIRYGGRTQSLQATEWDFSVPTGDAGWPDDALVELNYAPAVQAAP